MAKKRGQPVIDKILDTSARLFYTQGYNNTGINQVIKEADIAKGSLYKHFDSKADLMTACIGRLYKESYERLTAYLEQVQDPREKILAIFDYHSERQKTRAYGGCALVKANTETGKENPEVSTEIQEAKKKFKDFYRELVINSNHKQLLTDEELTETLFLMIEGSVVAASIYKINVDLQTARRIIEKLL